MHPLHIRDGIVLVVNIVVTLNLRSLRVLLFSLLLPIRRNFAQQRPATLLSLVEAAVKLRVEPHLLHAQPWREWPLPGLFLRRFGLQCLGKCGASGLRCLGPPLREFDTSQLIDLTRIAQRFLIVSRAVGQHRIDQSQQSRKLDGEPSVGSRLLGQVRSRQQPQRLKRLVFQSLRPRTRDQIREEQVVVTRLQFVGSGCDPLAQERKGLGVVKAADIEVAQGCAQRMPVVAILRRVGQARFGRRPTSSSHVSLWWAGAAKRRWAHPTAKVTPSCTQLGRDGSPDFERHFARF